MKHCTSLLLQGCLWLTALETSLAPSPACAQGPDAAAMIGSKFVPDDAVAIVTTSPAEWLENPALDLFPLEVFRVQAKEQWGIDPQNLSLVKVVVGFPANGQPQFGIILQFSQDVETEKLLAALAAEPEPIAIGNRSAYAIASGPPGTVLHTINARTLFIGMTDYLQPMIQADNGGGPLPTLLKAMPMRSGINAAIAMENIRPLVSGVAMQQAAALAPALQPLGQLPGLTDAVLLQIDLDGESAQIELTMVGTDATAAERIESILKDSLQAARELAIAEIQRTMASAQPSEEMQEATLQYAQRIAGHIIQTMTPKRSGDRVALTLESQLGVAGSGMLAGLLLPAIQWARTAAQRVSGANNLKQVLLGLHNYHAAYNQLPEPAITDAEGKPLLSWRVKLLPFVEEQALYEQFHLDEPWDSEHNLPLSKRLPAVYGTPGVRLAQGETVMQAVVGETIGLRPKGRTSFRDILDGTSNSILIVETRPDAAVPWSKPSDVAIDLDDPLAKFVGTPRKGFHVGMADGAVKLITDNIEPQLFKALLTRAGKEPIAAQFHR